MNFIMTQLKNFRTYLLDADQYHFKDKLILKITIVFTLNLEIF